MHDVDDFVRPDLRAWRPLASVAFNNGTAGKGLGKTRTDTLMPQPETGKISCVHHLPYARLSPGVRQVNDRPELEFPSDRSSFLTIAAMRELE
jgi:hypothetical protein